MLDELKAEVNNAYQTLKDWGIGSLETDVLACILQELAEARPEMSPELMKAMVQANALCTLANMGER